MSNKDEICNLANDLEALRSNYHEPCHSWTDDLPVCPLSGVGSCTNQRYRADGFRREEHSFEDRSFHFKYLEDTYFYGVFDGHAGAKAADFAAQRLPAEILLGQLDGKESDIEIQKLLHQAILAVERGFFESIDDLLAEKEKLRLQLHGLRTIEAINQFPDVVNRLKTVTEEVRSGTTAVVALFLNNKLYVANVGNSRAVLCKEGDDGKLRILPLTLDHTFNNEDELLRLSHLGLDIEQLRREKKNSTFSCTRCIGNYTVKGGYKEFDYLSEAEEEPVIAEPNIIGGIPIDEKCKFLILMSEGLYKSLEEATETTNPSTMLVHMLLDEFSTQSTLNGVAQAVVDKVVRMHHDAYMKDSGTPQKCQKRGDITLLIRNFNYDLPNADKNGINCSFKPNIITKSLMTDPKNIPENDVSSTNPVHISYSPSLDEDSPSFMFANDPSTNSSDSAGRKLFQSATNLSLDEDGKIKSYIDFSSIYIAIEEAKNDGLIIEEE